MDYFDLVKKAERFFSKYSIINKFNDFFNNDNLIIEIYNILNSNVDLKLINNNELSIIKMLYIFYNSDLEKINFDMFKKTFDITFQNFSDIRAGLDISSVEISSNYINIKSIINSLINNKNFIYTYNQNGFIVESTSLPIEAFEYNKPINVNPLFIEEINIHNSIRFKGKNEVVEQFYIYITEYLHPLIESAYVKNILLKLEFLLEYLPNDFKNRQCLSIFNNLDIFHSQNDITIISEIYKILPYSTNFNEALFILKKILELDYATPLETYNNIIENLKHIEKNVIKLRIFESQSLREIGLLYNLTRERIRQIEAKALIKIRKGNKLNLMRMSIKLYCGNSYFCLQEELDKYNLNIKLLKTLFGSDNSTNYDVFFWENEDSDVLMEFLNDLPEAFTKLQLDIYINKTIEKLTRFITYDDMSKLISLLYNCYGDYYTNKTLNGAELLSLILQNYFPNGLDIYCSKNMNLIRSYGINDFNYSFSVNDRAIQGMIQRISIPCGRGKWILDNNDISASTELILEIINFIDQYNSSAVPINGIFENFIEKFTSLGIENRYALQGYLRKWISNHYIINRDYVLKSEDASIYDYVVDFISSADYLITMEELMDNFPGITSAVVNQITSNTSIINMNGYYADIRNFQISISELQSLEKIVQDILRDNSVYNSRKIFEEIKGEMNGLFSRIGIDHYLQFYYLFNKLFPDKYSYLRPFIANVGVQIENGEVQLIKAVESIGECELIQLKELSDEIGVRFNSYIDFVDRNKSKFLFKDNNSIITLQNAGVDENTFNDLDDILTNFLGNLEYRPFYEFINYWNLPQININWNNWLIYSVTNSFSKKFSTYVTSNNIVQAVPLLVKKEFNVEKIDTSEIKNIYYEDVDFIELFDEEDLL